MTYRVDHVHRIATEPRCQPGCEATTWHATEDDALREAHRLRFGGVVFVVAWDAGAVA